MVEPSGKDCMFIRCAKQLRIPCPNEIQSFVNSLLNPEVGVPLDELDKASGMLSKPLWCAAPVFMWSLAFIRQIISLCFHRSVSLIFSTGFLFLVSLLGHLLWKHGGVLHSELQACIATNKTGQGKKECMFCVGVLVVLERKELKILKELLRSWQNTIILIYYCTYSYYCVVIVHSCMPFTKLLVCAL